jgi:uncharacterized protein YjiK
MEEQSTRPLPRIQNRRQPSARPPQQRRTLHLLVALLVVCALVGCMAVVLHAMYPTTEAGSSTTTPAPTPASLTWGKTLDSKPVDSLFSNVSSIAWAPNSQRVASLTYNGVQMHRTPLFAVYWEGSVVK